MERAHLLSQIKKILERKGARRKLMQRDKMASIEASGEDGSNLKTATKIITQVIPANNMPSIHEEATVKQYSVQAVGRKRNTMMNAMQLNDAEFLNWVQDRLYRLAHENERPVSTFTIKDLASGLLQWENLFSSQDKEWGSHRDDFMKYKDRFIKAASVILNTASASGSLNDPPSKAPPNNVDGSPSSPTMVKHQASDSSKRGSSTSSPSRRGGGEQEPEQKQEYGPMEYLQYFQQLLDMDDKEFAEFVQDKVLSGEKAPTNLNVKKVKQMLNKDEKEVDKVFNKSTKEIHKLYKEYAKRFLSTFEGMTSKED